MKPLQTKIETASRENLEACYNILMNSKLGQLYFSQKDPAKFLARAIDSQEIFVALNKENQTTGFIWVELHGTFGKYPYLHLIIVASDYQDQGIGQKLMNYFEDVITADYDKVFLLVADFNKRAKKLYEDLNYKEVGLLPDFAIDGVDEYLMMKKK